MALYLVKARQRKDRLDNPLKELSSGAISKMRPFEQALQHSLENARFDSDNALWIEEENCYWLWKEKPVLGYITVEKVK